MCSWLVWHCPASSDSSGLLVNTGIQTCEICICIPRAQTRWVVPSSILYTVNTPFSQFRKILTKYYILMLFAVYVQYGQCWFLNVSSSLFLCLFLQNLLPTCFFNKQNQFITYTTHFRSVYVPKSGFGGKRAVHSGGALLETKELCTLMAHCWRQKSCALWWRTVKKSKTFFRYFLNG